MAFSVEHMLINDASNNPCHHPQDIYPHIHQPRQYNLTLIAVSIIGALLLLGNTFLGYHYYNSLTSSLPPTTSVEGDSAGVLTHQLITLSNEEEVLTQLYEATEPAVVKIVVAQRGLVNLTGSEPRGDGLGTGVIFDFEGHIVTNHHVVDQAADVVVQLASGRLVKAQVVGQDPGTDLAVLRIDVLEEELTVAPFVDSDTLRVGQSAVAIGYPFGLDKSLTVGHISGLGRVTPTKDKYIPVIQNMIQTDAAINPGNSGGPLLNLRGELVGINSALFSTSRGWQGVGFAIPSNTVRQVIAELLEKGYVSRPFLGVVGLSLNPQRAKRLGLDVEQGLLIQEVSDDSPASQAGLQAGKRRTFIEKWFVYIDGDVLTAVDGQLVDSMTTLSKILQERAIGDTITLSVQRDDKMIELEAILGEQPAPDQ